MASLGLTLAASACKPQLPAPLAPTGATGGAQATDELAAAGPERGVGEAASFEAAAARIGPNWLPAPLSEVTPQLGTGASAQVLTPRVRIEARPQLSDAEIDAILASDERRLPEDTVYAELVVVSATTETTFLSVDFELDTEACEPVVELNAIEGLTVPDHYMFQLTCSGGGDEIFVDSYTMLVRVDAAEARAELLWLGEGTSLNERDACLQYDVVSFLADEGGKSVLAVRDREVLSLVDDPEVELEADGDPDDDRLECPVYPFEQVPAAEIDLLAPAGEGVVEYEVPAFDPQAAAEAREEGVDDPASVSAEP